jgi:DNA-directed RNA polymerase specialized sigma24 family protein
LPGFRFPSGFRFGAEGMMRSVSSLPVSAVLLSSCLQNEREVFTLVKYTKEDVIRKLQEYPSLIRAKQQLEFELSLLPESNADTGNAQTRSKLRGLLLPVDTELRRMDFYINLLAEDDKVILTALFFEKLTHKEMASRLSIDAKTIYTRKNRGLADLAAMYNRLPNDSR